MKRYNNIAFLRHLAALLVVYQHTNLFFTKPTVPNLYLYVSESYSIGYGTLGVSVFFFLSGYLITESVISEPRAKVYFSKRFFRIYPAFIVNYLTCALIFSLLAAETSISQYFASIRYLLISFDLVFFDVLAIPDSFAENSYSGGVNDSLWTLSVEFKMYIFSFIVFLPLQWSKSYRKLLPFFLALLLLIYFNYIVLEVTSRSFAMASYLIGVIYRVMDCRVIASKALAVLSGMVFVLIILNSYLDIFHPTISVILHYTFVLYALYYLGRKSYAWVGNFERYGDYSYGLYLYHWPIMQMLIALYGDRYGFGVFVVQSLILSYLFAFASWHFVERPAIRFIKARFHNK